jgi:hypothetical protein
MLRLLFDTIQLDLFDLNYAYSSENFNMLSLPQSALPRPGVLIRIGAFFWYFLKSCIFSFRVKTSHYYKKGCVIFAFTSKNQRDSLQPISKHIGDSILLEMDFFTRFKPNTNVRFPIGWVYFVAIVFFPLVIFKLLISRGYKRKSFRYAFGMYWLTYGHYMVSRLWLRWVCPRGVVVANDHTMPCRVFVSAAKAEGIVTFYVQHASVQERFPPLSFDYALLEGQDALHKYEYAGETNTKIYLIGIPKADSHYNHLNSHPTVTSIGICTNRLDPIPRIEQLCHELRLNFPELDMIIRPHPRDQRGGLWAEFADKYKLKLSNSTLQVSFDFLKQVDAVIAGNSNILLEAASLNVFPLFYDFLQEHRVAYGFQKNGLVEYLSAPEEIVANLSKLAKNKPYIRNKTKHYYATVDTNFDGQSSKLASLLICQLLYLTESEPFVQWRRLTSAKLDAYEPINMETLS